jgi:hypothetical protein
MAKTGALTAVSSPISVSDPDCPAPGAGRALLARAGLVAACMLALGACSSTGSIALGPGEPASLPVPGADFDTEVRDSGDAVVDASGGGARGCRRTLLLPRKSTCGIGHARASF